MRLQVSKWGNSLAVRLPANYAKQSGVSSGDYLEATITASGEMRLVPGAPAVDKAVLLKKLSALHKALPQTTSVMDALRKEARY
ncbi:MAG: AbrB/MazE/SpoVT family DNA-binding domain-containing protein [Nitrosomonadales bacterium]|nr:AbrB/MazE/SpoVT family DNA-binding domain-containing protein [Nitrosomonadales bacterium]